MRINALFVPIAVLAMGLGSRPASAWQENSSDERAVPRGERRNRGEQNQREGRSQAQAEAPARGHDGNQAERSRGSVDRVERRADRGDRGNQPQDRDRERASAPTRERNDQAGRGANPRDRQADSARESARGNQRADQRSNQRYDRRDDRRDSRDQVRGRTPEWNRDYDRSRSADRRDDYRYKAPRYLPRRSAPRHYYGSGGHLSLYFGLGSGYRYGSPYSGRVYGYARRSPAYGDYQHYGDVRLQVKPRHASVYVDGYYAGIVDDFDGFFQRLTLEIGPHEIEIEAPGFESEFFEVYVDRYRTVDVRAELFR